MLASTVLLLFSCLDDLPVFLGTGERERGFEVVGLLRPYLWFCISYLPGWCWTSSRFAASGARVFLFFPLIEFGWRCSAVDQGRLLD